MADPDCAVCEALGYRTCDECGGIVLRSSSERDRCSYCASQLPDGHDAERER